MSLFSILFSFALFATEAPPPPTPTPELSPSETPMETDETSQRPSFNNNEITADPNQDRYPDTTPMFTMPKGPDRGGTVRTPHPNAAKGLIKIDKDGNYYYKTGKTTKSQAGGFRVGTYTAPKVEGVNSGVTFDTIYKLSKLNSAFFEYEYQPFTSFGRMGLQLGAGLATVVGQGNFKTIRPGATSSEAREKYTLYILPLSGFLVYRFEYFNKQLFVPFINGGITYYGLAETRDDGKKPTVAGASAIGGGGGVHFSLSRLSSEAAFAMSSEYGIAELWLTVEGRTMKGLKQDIDFTNSMVSAGLTADY